MHGGMKEVGRSYGWSARILCSRGDAKLFGRNVAGERWVGLDELPGEFEVHDFDVNQGDHHPGRPPVASDEMAAVRGGFSPPP